MSLPYLLRLFCLCAASFFLVHLVCGVAVSTFAPVASRWAFSMRPRVAVRFLFSLRLIPVLTAAVVTFALCVPSYLWLEPAATREEVGWPFLAAAILGVSLFGFSAARVFRALDSTACFTKQCKRAGSDLRIAGEVSPILLVESQAPILALAGVWRPRLVISRAVLEALSRDQLETSLSHERAHQLSRDNVKRLLLLLAPPMLPFVPGFGTLERAWTRLSEWAADDFAAAENPDRSLSLASALVRIARMGTPPRLSGICTTLVGEGSDLAERVNRLLQPAKCIPEPRVGLRLLATSAVSLLGVFVAAAILRPATLNAVHELLERFIH